MHEQLRIKNIIFNSKADAVPYNYRMSYKIGQISLILLMCRGKKRGCSIFKLHMLSMGLSTKSEKSKLLRFCDGEEGIYNVIRFDPAVNRALNFALVDGIIFQQGNGLLCLTESGKQFASFIKDDETLMINEKLFLTKVSNKLPEEMVDNLIARWRNSYASN